MNDISRRGLNTALLGVFGASAAASLLQGCGDNEDGALAETVDALVTGDQVAWVATVLGAVPTIPPTPRTGDLALNGPTQIGARVVLARGAVYDGDGGGGLFLWDSSASRDNGGTIIVPSGAGMPVGCWRRVFSGAIDVRWFGAIPLGDAGPAINNAVLVANGRPVLIPAGTYTIATPIVRTASQGQSSAQTYRPGMKLIGEGMSRTILRSAVANDAMIKWELDVADIANPKRSYLIDSAIENMTLKSMPGTVHATAISLVAAWFVRLFRVEIDAMSLHGITAPWRGPTPTPNATIVSDTFQCLGLEIDQCWIHGCAGWGILFQAGQSPAQLNLHHSSIQLNALGGVSLQCGQFEMVNNLIGENGISSNEGGVSTEVFEGPGMVALIARNEFDGNFGKHLTLRSAQLVRVEQNRFLSILDNGAFRPDRHVVLGDGSSDNFSLCGIYENNYHRVQEDHALTLYDVHPQGSDVQANRFTNNLAALPAGGALLLTKYRDPNTNSRSTIVEKNEVARAAPMSPAVSAFGVAAADLGSAYEDVVFSNPEEGSSAAYDAATGVFVVPYDGLYSISSSITLEDLAAGTRVDLRVNRDTGTVVQVAQQSSTVAGGVALESFAITCVVALRAGDRAFMTARQSDVNRMSFAAGSELCRMSVLPVI